MKRTTINIDFPIDIAQGEAGFFYITSPLVPGLLVTGQTENEALARVPQAVTALVEALCVLELKS